MKSFFFRLFILLWAAYIRADRFLAAVLAPLWRPFQNIWRIIRPTRFSVFTLLAGGILLTLTAQGRELAVRLGDSGGPFSGGMIVFLAAVGWFAFQAWYWARISFYFDVGLDHRYKDWRIAWAPRFYAGAAFVFAAVSLYLAGLGGHAITALAVGAVFVVILVIRMPLVRALGGGRAGAGATQPTGFHDLPIASRITLGVSVASSLVTLFAVNFWPVPIGQALGAAAVAFLAFGHIVPVGSAAVIRSRETGFPVIVTTLILAVLVSPIADNHLVRPVSEEGAPAADLRPTVQEAADAWLDATTADGGGQARPVIFLSTAGGGLRAAYWTATVLGALQDRCPGVETRIFSISGVSGGSVGAAIYSTGLHNATGPDPVAPTGACAGEGAAMTDLTLDVLDEDFLGPTVAAMLYPDLVQRFVPLGFRDRGAALTASWNAAWHDACAAAGDCDLARGDLDSAFLRVAGTAARGAPWRPILLLNGTHQETGKRLIASNVVVAPDVFLDAYDLHALVGHDVSMGTAALNSARFTYVSPAGRLERTADGRGMGHVLDGGYFENYGAVTGAEIARAAIEAFEASGVAVRPILIQISSDPELEGGDLPGPATDFGSDGTGVEPAKWVNEVLGPVLGILNTRTARGVLANKTIADVVADFDTSAHRFPTVVKPVFVHFRMCGDGEGGRLPPLGWAMSKMSRDHIRHLIGAGCDEARSDNAEALAKVISALSEPVPVSCAPVEALGVTHCRAN